MTTPLPAIIKAFQDALEFWSINCSDKDLSAIPPAKTNDPLAEVVKIAKLIKAHTTKVGIIFEPSKLKKQSEAAEKTVTDMSKSYVLFMSALAQVSPLKVSELFYKEILNKSQDLLDNTIAFCKELAVLEDEASNGETKDEETTTTDEPSNQVNTRLVSVGKLWTNCDDLVKLVEAGNLKFLERKTKMHLTLIEDGLDEFSEWAENPEEVDDEDPFGLDESYSDTEEDKVPSLEDDYSDNDDDNLEKREHLISYCKLWLQKFKLVKLLFFSINKSLPTIPAGSDIDEIYRVEALICKEVDQLIVELMLNQIIDDEVHEHSTAIDRACFSILNIIKRANKNNDTKTKWCGSWLAKFTEILDSMYKK